jgi:hypothetical protein
MNTRIGKWISVFALVAMIATMVPVTFAGGPPHTLEIDGQALTAAPVITLSLPDSAYVGETVVLKGTADFSQARSWAWVRVPDNSNDPRTIVGDSLGVAGGAIFVADGKLAKVVTPNPVFWSMIDTGIQDPSSPEVWGDISGPIVQYSH